ncbi:MAG: hypothetical protein IPN94_28200 [Sphingobacteriales bacterium]|nr:hypothetical protein [Sphingobacteriales bacterium]
MTQIPLQNNLLVDSRPYNDFLQTYLTYQYQLDKQNLVANRQCLPNTT